MTYLKIVLTAIAILLTLHLVKPVIVSTAQARLDVIDVNIVEVDGRWLKNGKLPVTSGY